MYLGPHILNRGSSEEKIKRKLGMAKTAIIKLSNIWNNFNITKETKKHRQQRQR